ncbi:MAG: protein kinase [Steroidobacteraceae bacterium]|jgi:serine/threonine-protein kinase|nr:protein kinase [Steroidobacteraceae bacterium]
MNAPEVVDELKRAREYERLLLDAAEQALDWDPGQREARLAEDYGADEATLGRIRDLLAIAEAGRPARSAGPSLATAPDADPPPPPRIGPYRIGEPLGASRRGRRFAAEYSDGLYTRPVILELLRSGFSSEALEARFARECQALANLRHPQIARLLDSGVTAEGQAYLVTERLQGPSIVEHAAAHALSLRDTVDTFLGTCDAVAHAHARLFAHGDIQPRNVIVVDDQPKLLDFGVTGVLESTMPAVAATALPGSGPGPDPAPGDGRDQGTTSPARRRGEPATTLDDVYSLGVLLQTLLARHPDAPPDLRAGAERARAADPAARYPTVAALGDDLRRWLGGHTVRAHAGGWRYAAGKAIARHRLATGLAALALVLLAGTAITLAVLALRSAEAGARTAPGVAATGAFPDERLFDVLDRLERVPRTQALRRELAAQAQRDLDRLAADGDAPPEQQLELAERLRRLAQLQGAPDGNGLGDAAAARANLARATALTEAIADTRALRDARALTAVRLALLEAGVARSASADLRATEAALARARDRLDTLRARGTSTAEAAALEREWAVEQATLLQRQGRYRESREVASAALAAMPAAPAAADPGERLVLQRARLLEQVAASRLAAGQPAESIAAHRERLELLERAARTHPEDVVLGRRVARAGAALAEPLLALDRAAEAEPLLAQSRARLGQLMLLEPDDRTLVRDHDSAALAHAQALVRLRRFREAEPILRLSIADRSAGLDADPLDARQRRDLAIARASLGDLRAEQGQRRDACALYAQAASDLERARATGKIPRLDEDAGVRRLRAQQARYCAP